MSSLSQGFEIASFRDHKHKAAQTHTKLSTAEYSEILPAPKGRCHLSLADHWLPRDVAPCTQAQAHKHLSHHNPHILSSLGARPEVMVLRREDFLLLPISIPGRMMGLGTEGRGGKPCTQHQRRWPGSANSFLFDCSRGLFHNDTIPVLCPLRF